MEERILQIPVGDIKGLRLKQQCAEVINTSIQEGINRFGRSRQVSVKVPTENKRNPIQKLLVSPLHTPRFPRKRCHASRPRFPPSALSASPESVAPPLGLLCGRDYWNVSFFDLSWSACVCLVAHLQRSPPALMSRAPSSLWINKAKARAGSKGRLAKPFT